MKNFMARIFKVSKSLLYPWAAHTRKRVVAFLCQLHSVMRRTNSKWCKGDHCCKKQLCTQTVQPLTHFLLSPFTVTVFK